MKVHEALVVLEDALRDRDDALDDRVEVYNRLVALAADYLNIPHPVTRVQLIPIDTVRGNDIIPIVWLRRK